MSNKTVNAAAGQDTGMLQIFDSIQVKNEEKISQADIQFCEKQQESLYKTLAQLTRWYDVFYQDSQKYTKDEKIKYLPNGMVKICNYYVAPYYDKYEYTPFQAMNEIVEKRREAIEAFARETICYFNKTYDTSVPVPELDKDKLPVDFQPEYMTYVDAVIEHLGGRSFRQTAEDELIKKLHNAVHRYNRHDLPDLKSKSIVFYSLFSFDEIYLRFNQNKIKWEYEKYIETLCAGLAFYAHDRLNGDTGIVYGYKSDNINISESYPLSTSPAEYMKFYKNGRVDVKFKDAASAEECFKKLKLNEL
jgi:6-pyruvoyl-tetrahydropterin synthase